MASGQSQELEPERVERQGAYVTSEEMPYDTSASARLNETPAQPMKNDTVVMPPQMTNVEQGRADEPRESSQLHLQNRTDPAQSHASVEMQPERADTAQDDGYYAMALDVDSENSDADSAIGESLASSYTSLRSSLYESVEENGRTYHTYKQGTYYLPNDEVEQDRLDLQHHLFLLTLDGKLNMAPISNPHAVLDIGTGTGIWAVEFATQNPSAVVIGTDLSAIQPNYVPPNCQFEVDDAEDMWVYNRKFDYIHGRALFSCFKDPKSVFQKAYDNLTPGGYFEMQDVYFKPHSNDGTVDRTDFARWNEIVVEGAKKLGRDWHCVPYYKQWFEEVGFQDVVERRMAWPLNPWAKGKKMKTMGLWSMSNALEGIVSISMAIMTRVLGKSTEEVDSTLMAVSHDIKNSRVHSYWPVYIVYGRKPL